MPSIRSRFLPIPTERAVEIPEELDTLSQLVMFALLPLWATRVNSSICLTMQQARGIFGPRMTKDKFLLAREYITTDVERELSMARASINPKNSAILSGMKVKPGGGNFLSALAMLCYTEFAGSIATNNSAHCRVNFETFLRSMGQAYADLLDSGMDVYKLFRCGMAHEYFAKDSIEVTMFGNPKSGAGIGRLADGRLYFCLEPYYKDFLSAFDALGKSRSLT